MNTINLASLSILDAARIILQAREIEQVFADIIDGDVYEFVEKFAATASLQPAASAASDAAPIAAEAASSVSEVPAAPHDPEPEQAAEWPKTAEDGVLVDSRGCPWLQGAHSDSQTTTKDGFWRRKKGADPAWVERFEQHAIKSRSNAPEAAPAASVEVSTPTLPASDEPAETGARAAPETGAPIAVEPSSEAVSAPAESPAPVEPAASVEPAAPTAPPEVRPTLVVENPAPWAGDQANPATSPAPTQAPWTPPAPATESGGTAIMSLDHLCVKIMCAKTKEEIDALVTHSLSMNLPPQDRARVDYAVATRTRELMAA